MTDSTVVTAKIDSNSPINSDGETGPCSTDGHNVPLEFPQPQPNAATSTTLPYRYLRFEHIESALHLTLQEGTLCWVMLSQGKNKTPRLFKPARVIQLHNNKKDSDNDTTLNSENHPPPKDSAGTDARMLVQYPKGSTYWVRQSNLVPVLEHHHHLVLVTSETRDYRRMAMVHTTWKDHFVEIGCDFGILVDSVQAKSAVGIDKSETSIKVAKETYPTREFVLGDIFEDHDLGIPRPDRNDPLVVAIDINGNRDLPAVLKCIQLALTWSPRLIVVKSRALYSKMTTTSEADHQPQQD